MRVKCKIGLVDNESVLCVVATTYKHIVPPKGKHFAERQGAFSVIKEDVV